MTIPGARLQRIGAAMEKPDDLYQHFFEKLSGQEESEEAFFTLLPQAAAGSQDVIAGPPGAEHQLAAVKDLLLKMPGPPPDLHEEWQLAADALDDNVPAQDTCSKTVMQQVPEQVDENGVVVVPWGHEHSTCILDVAAELHVKVDNLVCAHSAVGHNDSTWTDVTVPSVSAYVPTAVQLAAGPNTAQDSSRHSNQAGGGGHSLSVALSMLKQPRHDAQYESNSTMQQLPPTTMVVLNSCKPCSTATPKRGLQDVRQTQVQDGEVHTVSSQAGLHMANIKGEADISQQCVRETGCGEGDQDQVQAFSLDPSFDYDNVKLTAREFPTGPGTMAS